MSRNTCARGGGSHPCLSASKKSFRSSTVRRHPSIHRPATRRACWPASSITRAWCWRAVKVVRLGRRRAPLSRLHGGARGRGARPRPAGPGRRRCASSSRRSGHCSNLYGNVPALELARRLIDSSFARRIWFANSGTEANEAALKFARLHGRAVRRRAARPHRGLQGRVPRPHDGGAGGDVPSVLSRAIRAAGPGRALRRLQRSRIGRKRVVDRTTAAVIVEPVQGEGGVVPADPDFLRGAAPAVRRVTRRCSIFDEVQCGLGRMGTLYAYQAYGVVPDLLTLAKPLAGGLPLGARCSRGARRRHC